MSEYSLLEEVLHARTFKDRVTLRRKEYESLPEEIQADYQYVGDGHFTEKEPVFEERKAYWNWEREHWDEWLYED